MIKYFKNAIIKNEFMQEVDGSTLTNYTDRADEIINYSSRVKFIYGLLAYGKWRDNKNLDLFQYINPKYLNFLRSKKDVYFLFDCTLEGWSPLQVNFIDILYKNCANYHINPSKIVFATSNLLDKENHIHYLKDKNIFNKIKIVTYPHFKTSALNSFWDITKKERTSEVILRYMKYRTYKEYQEKYFISFSRLNRKHRTLASYLLYINDIEKYGLISQNKLIEESGPFKTEESLKSFCRQLGINYTRFKEWSNTLPRTIDTNDFVTNHAHNLNVHIYSSALFEIVNETQASSFGNTSLFYSEKTFKPMACMTPFVIFGQQYANEKLQDLGFKLYTDMFDYTFDREYDTRQRYMKIIETIQPIFKKLNAMSREEQLAWKYQNEDILLHNLNILRNEFVDIQKIIDILEDIKKEQLL